MEIVFVVLGVAMLTAMFVLAGSMARDEPRVRARWDAAFDRESRALRHTDATGVLRCRRCGASGSEKAGRCPSCGAAL
jgi:rubrerythrin